MKCIRKILSLAVILGLIVSMLAACKTENSKKSDNDSNTNDKIEQNVKRPLASTWKEFENDSEAKILCFEMGWTGPEKDLDFVTPEIYNRTGFKLIYEPLTLSSGDELNTQMNLMVASNDLPDIFFGGADAYILDIYEKLGQSGKIWDVAPIIKDYKNIYELLHPELNKFERDGKNWFIPTQTGRGIDQIYNGRAGVYVREDFMKKLGITEYPDTIEKLETYIRRCVEEIKEVNGKSVLPLVIDEGYYSIGSIIDAFMPVSPHIGDPGIYFDRNNNYKVENVKYTDTPYLRNAMKTLNRWYKQGIIDKEAITNKHDMYTQKISSARAAAALGVFWDMNTFSDSARQIVPEVMYVCTPELRSETYGTPNTYYDWTAGISMWSTIYISKKLDEKTTRHFMALLDYLATQEGQLLVQAGIEGKSYEWDSNKKYKFTEEFKNKTSNLDWNKAAAYGVFYWSQLVFDINKLSEIRAEIPDIAREDNRKSWENKASELARYKPDMEPTKDYYFEPGPVEREKMPQITDAFAKLLTECMLAPDEAAVDRLCENYGKLVKTLGIDDVVAERQKIIDSIKIK